MGRPATALVVLALSVLALAGCGGGEHTTTSSTLPVPQPGSTDAAPGVPTSREGDNSIQTFGREASSVERAQAARSVQAYLDARAARDWPKVCAHLAAKPRAEQRQLSGGADCARAMEFFAREASTATLRREAEIEILSLRVGVKYAFLIYRRPDGIYATALTHDGRWKLISVTPNPVG